MTEVQFCKYDFIRSVENDKEYIYDILRKKKVLLTPEEWVRQHIIHHLIHDKKYSPNLMAVERGIDVNGMKKRFDVVVFSSSGKPKMIIECKAPEEVINQAVFMQAASYNLRLNADYFWLSNGDKNFCCTLRQPIGILSHLPEWNQLNV
jgi:hypothetical protein